MSAETTEVADQVAEQKFLQRSSNKGSLMKYLL